MNYARCASDKLNHCASILKIHLVQNQIAKIISQKMNCKHYLVKLSLIKLHLLNQTIAKRSARDKPSSHCPKRLHRKSRKNSYQVKHSKEALDNLVFQCSVLIWGINTVGKIWGGKQSKTCMYN